MGVCLRALINSVDGQLSDKRMQLAVLALFGAGFYGIAAKWFLREQWLQFRTLARIPVKRGDGQGGKSSRPLG